MSRDIDSELEKLRIQIAHETSQWDRYATGEYRNMADRVNAAVAAESKPKGFLEWCRKLFGAGDAS